MTHKFTALLTVKLAEYVLTYGFLDHPYPEIHPSGYLCICIVHGVSIHVYIITQNKIVIPFKYNI